MRFPKWITEISVVRTGKGIYTPQITHDGTIPNKLAQQWISKNGMTLMRHICSPYKVRKFFKK